MVIRKLLVSGALAAAMGAVTATPAHAWSDALYCNGMGSGSVCWLNYYDTHSLSDVDSGPQYGRDSVCAKARNNVTTGPVSPGSVCRSNTNYARAYFVDSYQQKKGYGYWAGNGGNIWVRVSGGTP